MCYFLSAALAELVNWNEGCGRCRTACPNSLYREALIPETIQVWLLS